MKECVRKQLFACKNTLIFSGSRMCVGWVYLEQKMQQKSIKKRFLIKNVA